MKRYDATIKWLDNGNIEDVIIKVGDIEEDDDDIFFYMESEEEIDDFRNEGHHDFVIINI